MRTFYADEIAAAADALRSRAAAMPPDAMMALECAGDSERCAPARAALQAMLESAQRAYFEGRPLCPLPARTAVLAALGKDAAVAGGTLEQALSRGAGEDAELAVRRVPGSGLALTVLLLCGRCAAFDTLTPLSGRLDPVLAAARIADAAKTAGTAACPPLVLGAGIGGSPGDARALSLRALARPLDTRSPSLRRLEWRAKEAVNALEIGPCGLGGFHTALAVNAEAEGAPAFLSVRLCCHAVRRASRTL